MTKILLVKLSSLGDVVHTLPVVQDIHRAVPNATIDWVAERAFAPLPALLPGVRRVVACEIRLWRKHLLSRTTWQAWQAFRAELQAERYDAIIDLQGLTKSAIMARLARLAPSGKRFAMANQTDGSGYEAPTRWLAGVALPMPPHIHAVQRGRTLAALALGYPVPTDPPDCGLAGLEPRNSPKTAKNNPFSASNVPLDQQTRARAAINLIASVKPVVAWVHGSSRLDKCWPAENWLELGRRLHASGWQIALIHGSPAEEAQSQAMADALNAATGQATAALWPRLPLDALTRQLAQACQGVIGVDSGISHIAVALGLPHVQIYNFDTAWRTGPWAHPLQTSVFNQPVPSVEAVWQAWLQCVGNTSTVAA